MLCDISADYMKQVHNGHDRNIYDTKERTHGETNNQNRTKTQQQQQQQQQKQQPNEATRTIPTTKCEPSFSFGFYFFLLLLILFLFVFCFYLFIIFLATFFDCCSFLIVGLIRQFYLLIGQISCKNRPENAQKPAKIWVKIDQKLVSNWSATGQ